MNGDWYEMERHIHREIRKNANAEMQAGRRKVNLMTTLRAAALVGSICLVLLGMCQLKHLRAEPLGTGIFATHISGR